MYQINIQIDCSGTFTEYWLLRLYLIGRWKILGCGIILRIWMPHDFPKKKNSENSVVEFFLFGKPYGIQYFVSPKLKHCFFGYVNIHMWTFVISKYDSFSMTLEALSNYSSSIENIITDMEILKSFHNLLIKNRLIDCECL